LPQAKQESVSWFLILDVVHRALDKILTKVTDTQRGKWDTDFKISPICWG